MRNTPFKGRVKLGLWSGIKKLARAMRRGLLDPEREHAIRQAEILGALAYGKQKNRRKAKTQGPVRAAASPERSLV